MSGWKIGARVGAIASANEDGVRFFGYGTYQGEEVPPVEIKFMGGLSLGELGRKNPKIVLDSGDVVWGCECWWGSEEKIRELTADRKVIPITPSEYRTPKGS